MRCVRCALVLALLLLPDPVPAWRADTVKFWARTLGDELWKLSEALTKSDQIRGRYKQMNASVKRKDGNQILDSSLRSVSTMLTRKINAVQCIHATAERLAEEFNYTVTEEENYTFEYCSAKYSKFSYENPEDAPELDEEDRPRFTINNSNYMSVALEKDSHFYNIYVNTNTSCVHVPTNIYYKEPEALNAILWSKGLNEIFQTNYQSDPSLSWQYFGSSHGVLRFYPGMPWNQKEVDIYDARVKSWYIEAATCSKDVIILFDVSGSMTGFKNYVARRTLGSLLDTLSNNDYINVFTFKNEVKEVVQCFRGLVQATPENLKTISQKLEPTDGGKKHKVPLEGNANLTLAYMKAFETLKERRGKCNVSSTQGCNQLVMLITDYVPGNLTEVFEEYNREVVGNKTYIPVRVFTYLIGKEVTNVQEIRWMACLNRGYFVHIHSVEEVQQQVLEYINVIAQPMILSGEKPPPTWTHANIDSTRTMEWEVSDDVEKPDEDKLVTSVAMPAFDYNTGGNSHAVLLGVAGTDVPIDSIAKLAQPHQLGVNGYSFIVSNNGYLLLHPLLITTINGKLQKNYNSVDFVEVEQVDDGNGPRVLGDKILQLRQFLVAGESGKMTGVEVLYHYDNMRRISRVKHDYFFNKLEGTPFSMGISLPQGYGDTELLLKDNPLEAKQGMNVTGINVTDYFNFTYRVHRDWVYCKYHYLEGHESDNAEIEVWKFLVRLSKNDMDITKKQYDDDEQSLNFNVSSHCGSARRGLERNAYYCNEDLVKQLVFDAKLSTPYFKTWNASQAEWDLAKTYNVSVRFIAAASGMTRWHYIFDEHKNERVDEMGNRHKNYTGKVFGDRYFNAIEETWYKAAVLQHMVNQESLVIATPLPILDDIIEDKPSPINDDGDITITASYAIFYKDGNSSTPASVVGFEYSYKAFYKRFLEITKMSGDETLEQSCNGTEYNCYVIDSSGYVVLSSEVEDVGQFFGAVGNNNKYVLKSLLEKNIYDYVDVFNYQALCPSSLLSEGGSGAWSLLTPFSVAKNLIRWLLTEAVLVLSDIYNWNQYAYAKDVDDDYNDLNTQGNTEMPTSTNAPCENNNTKPKEEEEGPFSCDHQITLYILKQPSGEEIGAAPVINEDEPGKCHPAYWAAYVPWTNLLLVVVKAEELPYDNCPKPPDTKPQPTKDSTTNQDPCHKLDLGRLYRRRLEGCFTYHDKENEINRCGRGSSSRGQVLIVASAAVLAAVTSLLPL